MLVTSIGRRRLATGQKLLGRPRGRVRAPTLIQFTKRTSLPAAVGGIARPIPVTLCGTFGSVMSCSSTATGRDKEGSLSSSGLQGAQDLDREGQSLK
jgi:hypothetical protein